MNHCRLLVLIVATMALTNAHAERTKKLAPDRPSRAERPEMRKVDPEKPLNVDLDGDGQSEAVTRRIVDRRTGEQTAHVLELRLASKSIPCDLVLRRRVGMDGVQYWVSGLSRMGDLDGDGLVDLSFYAGDDTSEDVILLMNRRTHFEAVYRGVIGLDLIELGKDRRTFWFLDTPRLRATWYPERAVWHSKTLRWTTAPGCGYAASRPIAPPASGGSCGVDGKVMYSWQRVKLAEEDVAGWVCSRFLSSTSPVRRFCRAQPDA